MLKKKKNCRGTDNNIGNEGYKIVSDMLKYNKTLTELNLSCDEREASNKTILLLFQCEQGTLLKKKAVERFVND